MAISLSKGGNMSLTKAVPGLQEVIVGLGWDLRTTTGAGFDLDASAFLLQDNNQVGANTDFIFYNQRQTPDGAVVHSGDNRTGQGEGDDETISVNLQKVRSDVTGIIFVASIFEARKRGQNFGQVSNAYIRVVDATSGSEITRFDLSEDASTDCSMIFGEVYRHNGEWKFRAIGQGRNEELVDLARSYGVQV